ncbi:MAG: hypothetical protein KDD61_14915 [Bdellovibrionales bacterium]|nr:hypothetical protein [Bdellovibrionales bacterium]
MFLLPQASSEILDDSHPVWQFYGDAIPGTVVKFIDHTDPYLEARIEEQYTQILRSESLGRDICQLLGRSTANYQVLLGINEAAAVRLIHECQKSWPDLLLSNQSFALEKIFAQPRQYWKVYVKGAETLPLWSWTKASNRTVLFLKDGEELADSQLRDILIHETAIALDGKFDIDEENWNFPQSRRDRCSLLAAIHLPSVKTVSTTLRALDIEWSYGSGQTDGSTENLEEKGSCRQKFIALYDKMKESLDFLNKQEFYEDSFWRPFCRFQEDVELLPQTKAGFLQALEILESEVTVTSSGRVETLCEYLSTPQLSNQNIRFSRGPKPRFTGGW